MQYLKGPFGSCFGIVMSLFCKLSRFFQGFTNEICRITSMTKYKHRLATWKNRGQSVDVPMYRGIECLCTEYQLVMEKDKSEK